MIDSLMLINMGRVNLKKKFWPLRPFKAILAFYYTHTVYKHHLLHILNGK